MDARGRAVAAHSLAANLANDLGQIYVATMCAFVGASWTFVGGGVVVMLFTLGTCISSLFCRRCSLLI